MVLYVGNLPFDATDGRKSTQSVSRIGDNLGGKPVATHWAYFAADGRLLADVALCLVPDDAAVLDAARVQGQRQLGVPPVNVGIGPVINLTGERGIVVVSAYTGDTTTGDIGAGEADTESGRGFMGYDLADYLEQHLSWVRRYTHTISDAAWEALCVHVTHDDDIAALAESADKRARYTHAEAFYRKAAATGQRDAQIRLAEWLRWQRGGLKRETEKGLRNAVAAICSSTNPVAAGEPRGAGGVVHREVAGLVLRLHRRAHDEHRQRRQQDGTGQRHVGAAAPTRLRVCSNQHVAPPTHPSGGGTIGKRPIWGNPEFPQVSILLVDEPWVSRWAARRRRAAGAARPVPHPILPRPGRLIACRAFVR